MVIDHQPNSMWRFSSELVHLKSTEQSDDSLWYTKRHFSEGMQMHQGSILRRSQQ